LNEWFPLFDKDISKTKAILGKHSREEDCEVAELRLPDIFCMNSGDARPVMSNGKDTTEPDSDDGKYSDDTNPE
jgi:hypothetical protein